jgi:predicted DNA-binding protein
MPKMEKLNQQVNIRLSEDSYIRLQDIADKEYRSLSDVCRMILEAGVMEAESARSLADFMRGHLPHPGRQSVKRSAQLSRKHFKSNEDPEELKTGSSP